MNTAEPRDARQCECGYDLAGIAGPPWICPECNTPWTPEPAWKRELTGAPFTDGEQWWIRGGIAALALGLLTALPITVAVGAAAAGAVLPLLGVSMTALPISRRWARTGAKQQDADFLVSTINFVIAWLLVAFAVAICVIGLGLLLIILYAIARMVSS